MDRRRPRKRRTAESSWRSKTQQHPSVGKALVLGRVIHVPTRTRGGTMQEAGCGKLVHESPECRHCQLCAPALDGVEMTPAALVLCAGFGFPLDQAVDAGHDEQRQDGGDRHPPDHGAGQGNHGLAARCQMHG